MTDLKRRLDEARQDRDALWALCLDIAQDADMASPAGPDLEQRPMMVALVRCSPDTGKPLPQGLGLALVLPSDGQFFHWETVKDFLLKFGAVGYVVLLAEATRYQIVAETFDGRKKAWSALRARGLQSAFEEILQVDTVPALFPVFS
jgi:hypothetical protein